MAADENEPLVRLDPQPGYKFRKWKGDANKKIESASKEFIARNYQLEMLEAAKRENTIVLMPTGAGKTFVAVLLIKYYSHQLQLPIERGGKRTFFLVNQVTLVAQQGKVLADHTGLKVGQYSGASNKAGNSIDHWDIEFWRQELYEHQIVVCTTEIFRKMLAHQFISPTDVNVLVLDECHHAKLKKNHPMSKIMQNFWAPYVGAGAGRVLGLTASVIDQRNCKVESLRLQLRDLEKCLLCKIVTPRQFSAEIDSIATPTPEILGYDYTAYGGGIKGELDNLLGVLDSVDTLPETDKSTFKKVKHIIRNLPFVIKEVGLDALRQVLPHYIDEVENFLCTPLLVTGFVTRYTLTVVLSQLNVLQKHIISLLESEEEVKMSPKFFSLLQFMIDQRREQEEGSEEARVIIFEEKRIIVEVMWKYLCYLMSSEGVEECAFMRAGYVLGGSTGGRVEDEVNLDALEEVRKKQDQTLQDFRCGKLNILIATSVVEEGLDIPACNIVVRYCFPQTYRGFVQSRGRARAKPARFVFFIDLSEIEPRRSEIRNYGKIEEFLKEYANSERTEDDDEEDDESEEEMIPSLYVEVTGAKLTADMAIQHLNFYCDQLPKDGYTNTMPKEDTIQTNFEGFVTTLTMPKLSPIRQVTGQPMQNRKNAKKSAAMEALKQLYHAKEFDTHLVPHFRQSENNTLLFEKQGERSLLLDQKIKIPSAFWRKDMLNSQSVTKCERIVVNEYHLYAIEMSLTPKVDNFVEYFSSSPYHKVCCYGIVSPSLLPEMPLFDVYPRYGEVQVKIRYIKTMKVPSPQVISNLQWFHSTIFTKILAIEKVRFVEQLLFKNYLIVPLSVKPAKAKLGCNFGTKGTGTTPSSQHELDIAHSFITQLRARWNEQKNCWSFGSMPQSADKCKDCVLFQHYRYSTDTDNANLSNAFFVVIGISEYTANSVMEHGKNQDSYGAHHEEKYNVKIENWEEPLLKSRHLSKRYNMLSDKGKKQEAGEYASTRSTLHLIREVHKVHPFPASLWNQATCLPSILWRMETLCLTGELYSKLLPVAPVERVTGHLTEYISVPCCDLITKLERGNEAECDVNYVGMIQCLTTSKCQEPFNLERLEFLGDSFLKFIFAVYFYRTMPEKHEGWLSKFRSEVTSNANLRRRSIESIDLPRYVFNKACLPNNNWLPPNYLPELTYEKLLEKIEQLYSTEDQQVDLSQVDLEQAISQLTEDDLLPVLNAHLPDCYLQEMGDKVIPDSMEALIGLFVSQGGYGAAVNLLDTIGLGVVPGLEENESLLCEVLYQPTPPPQVISTTAKHRDLTTATQFVKLQEDIGYTFKNPLYLLEALTHATYSDITACYQRLEFLGDAILDELMVCHIFENNTGLGPGKLSDLKSNLVCNTTLSKVSMRYGFHTNILYDSPELYLTLNRFYKNFQDRADDLKAWYTTNFDLTDVVYDGNEEEKHQELDLDHQVVQVPKILGDIVESVIGAIYLDSREDMSVVWGVIWPWFKPFYDAYRDTIPKQPKAKVHELYPVPRVQISPPVEVTNHKSRITVTIITTSGERYSFPTIGRDKMSVTNVCFDRALKFHHQHLAVN